MAKSILDRLGGLLDDMDTVQEVEAPFQVNDNITHKLTIHKARAKNFRSIGNQFMEIDFQRNKNTLVTSDDNGAGKSTMLVWLLFYVLYNDTYSKKEKKSGLLNSQNRKECVGEVEFSTRGSEWMVRRGIKPDFVEVHQKIEGEWKKVENDAAKADTNKYIVNLLGIDQKMFENSLVMGKDKFVPFTEMYTADRRNMVESIWDLGFFSLMNDDVKQAIKAATKRLLEIDQDLQLTEVEHSNKSQRLEQIEQSNALIQKQSAEFLESKRQDIKALETSIEEKGIDGANIQTEITVVENKLANTSEQLNTENIPVIEAIYQEAKDQIEKIQLDVEEKIQDYGMNEISFCQASISSVQKLIEQDRVKLQNITDKRNENFTLLSAALQRQAEGLKFQNNFQLQLQNKEKAIQDFHDMGTCPTCNQLVSDEAKAEISEQYQPEIDKARNNIERANQALDQLAKTIAEHQAIEDTHQEEISQVNVSIRNKEAELSKHNSDLRELQNDIKNFEREAEIMIASINREKANRLEENTRNLAVRYQDLTSSLRESLQRISGESKGIQFDIGDLLSKKRSLESEAAELEAKLLIKPTPTDSLKDEIDELDLKLSGLQTEREEADNNLRDHEDLLFFLKDDQTKARIISLYLPFLNSKINEYLEGMNTFLDIIVDDTFDITMGTAGRKGQSLFSLSSGQRVRVNIAITMALRDVANLKASVQCNILVFDEVLENLSERGIQECIEMLKYKFTNNNLFVISQREQELQEYFQAHIRYGLRNGMTQVIGKD